MLGKSKRLCNVTLAEIVFRLETLETGCISCLAQRQAANSEAIVSGPLLLHGVGKQTTRAGQRH